MTGSCNYVWTILIDLIFFFPYLSVLEEKKNSDKNSIIKAVIMFCAGIIAGWTNENIAPVFVLLVCTTIVWSKIKLNRIPVWMITGLLGVACGTALLLLAPGNSVRAEDIATRVNAGYSVLKTLIVRCYYIERAIFTCLFPTLLILGIILFITIKVYKICPDIISIMFVSAGGLSVGAMIMSPTYPIRATFGWC